MTDRTQNPRPPLLSTALSRLLASRVPTPRVIALGEPTHGDETFLTVRNDIVSWIADDFGLAAIALETSADASRHLDEYVRGEADDLDRALEAGFSHGFGRFPGNRDLLIQLRSINRAREADDHIRCVGIDADMELTAEVFASPERAQERIVERTTRMADHVDRLVGQIGQRGPVLLHAHNTHIHRAHSTMQLGPQRIGWDALGHQLATRHGEDYLVVATSCSAAPARGVPAAPNGTIEHLLDGLADGLADGTADGTEGGTEGGTEPVLVNHRQLGHLINAHRSELRMRDDLTPAMALGPLDPATLLSAVDAVIHISQGERGPLLTPEQIRDLLSALPDVEVLVAGPDTGAPDSAWGDFFFTVQPQGHHDLRRMPFATIVASNYPGFDEDSQLDRDDVFALNVRVGPEYFGGLLGFPPEASPAHRERFDPAAAGILMPHPLYGSQAWIRIINPPAAQTEQLIGLAGATAHRVRTRLTGGQGDDTAAGVVLGRSA
ncbi:MAG: DUF6194 family protein [Dietzia sp.]